MPRFPSAWSPVLAGLGLCITLSLLSSGSAFAQAIDTTPWVTNGDVNAVVRSGNTLYIGGGFTRVGPVTGGGVPIDATSGVPESGFPKVDGYVSSVAPDGSGGWYIGGLFTAVGGIPRQNIARILADHSVAAWNPGASSEVSALVVSGNLVYVGGWFGIIGGQTRSHIAALDATTGFATTWNPNASAPSFPGVAALAVSGTTIFAAGWFDSIGGKARNNIAALNNTNGAATTWDANANGSVYALAVSGTTVYAGGSFSSIGGQARNNIAALNTSGAATTWNPNANIFVLTLAVSGTTVYAGGEFRTIGGQARSRIAALDATTGNATAWNPNADDRVLALAVSGTSVYAGGWFKSIGGQARNRIAALDATTGAATAWNPNANSYVYALAASGTTVYVGGGFTNIGGAGRNRIAALDATTGLASAWNPSASDVVQALAVSGTTVYAGGTFINIGGATRNHIAALDAATGLATAWNPDANSWVEALALSGPIVYVGGSFNRVGGQMRSGLAAVDTSSGLPTGWNADANSSVHAVALSGPTIYAGGDFVTIGGQTRNKIAALDTASGLATAWNPGANNYVRALAVSGRTVYAGGDFTGSIGGQTRNYLAALDSATGFATAWNPNVNGSVLALAINGTTLYAGGSFTSIGGQMRRGIAAIAAAPAVSAILPASGGNAGPVTVTISGSGLPSGTATKLWRSGQPEIFGTGVVAAADGLSLTATFDLSGAAMGPWDVVVMTPDAQMAVLAGGFTVEAVEAPQLRVDVLGPALIRGNHRTAFDLVLENPGNTDARGVPLWITGVPADATVDLDFPLAYPPRDGGEPDWSQVPLSFAGPGGRYLALVIPRVPPGTMTRRVALTVPATVSTFQLRAALTPPWVDGATLRNCLSDGGVIGNPPCMGMWLTAINSFLAANPQLAALSGIAVWAKIAWQCEGAASQPAAVAKAEQVLGYMLRPVEESGSVAASCGEVLSPRWREVLAVSVVTSVDPNDKLGAHGTLSGQQALPYSVRFENLSSATAPAQQVVVVDALDPLKLDANTVSLDAITFGSVRLMPPPGLMSYATQVDLRPGQNLLVNVSASLDRFTGVLSWYFLSIDPVTGQPPTSPLVGFLPPNLVPPEGEGSVLFTVVPRAGLATGTQIGNRAAITFDDPPAVNTPEWLNTLDNTPPASQVLPLSANQDSLNFTVRWEATGAPPDLRDFTIYVAEDGGAYRAWRLNVAATADTFACRSGRSYFFYSVARDLSGNIEAAPASPDAQTFARVGVGEPGEWRLALAGAHPNPALGAIHAWFTLPSREPATLELMDIAGRRVARREVGSLGPGTHMVAIAPASGLKPGLYFLRLRQGARMLTARVAVIR